MKAWHISGAAGVTTWELYHDQNAARHNTRQYELLDGPNPALVLRRGQTFFFVCRMTRPVDPERENIILELAFGSNPSVVKGTLVRLRLQSSKFQRPSGSWDAKLPHPGGPTLSVEVAIPFNAGVGLWRMRLVASPSGGVTPRLSQCPELVYILFNPWSKEDPCYLSKKEDREEYVLNEVGKIFVGTYQQPTGRRWIYGQFGVAVLPAVMFVLERSKLDYTARGNPVRVARAVAALVNAQDENGVIVGNWSGQYEGGTAPWTWTGSAAILEQFLQSGGVPVKFGQCWVFAGVAATICRALGIPCRTVTNFVSAHDTDETLTIDKYFNETGEEIPGTTSDSIWNFHVWNDCWMARPDLPVGYGGWQAIDATPQETSEGVYRAGPASLEAIRRGEIGFLYDSPFIFSEVNADIMHWQKDEGSDLGWRKLNTDKYHIGRCILTKMVGVDDDEGDKDSANIIDEYKKKEGTLEERMAVLNAARVGNRGHIYDLPSEGGDVVLDLLDIEVVPIGKPFRVMVSIHNKSREIRTIAALLSASTVHYTGVTASCVKNEAIRLAVPPGQKETVHITVMPEEYLEKLVEYCMMKIYALATVRETRQTWAEEDDFLVTKPHLNIKVTSSLTKNSALNTKIYENPQVGRPFNVNFNFQNPLNKKLQNCKLTIEGPGLSEPMILRVRDVEPEAAMSHNVSLQPRRDGSRKLVAVFNSDQLLEIQGSLQITVLP
ncbi:F13A1 [Cordylochernes scorpioides]|uniref:F13A1 n=1 Tax=Cordylochernes scorpioides TaxID=51811 RepID=A0ABY6LWB1_9ARAC|nr:F13A1 [Cordylochernes scorpioides]